MYSLNDTKTIILIYVCQLLQHLDNNSYCTRLLVSSYFFHHSNEFVVDNFPDSLISSPEQFGLQGRHKKCEDTEVLLPVRKIDIYCTLGLT